MINLTSHDAAAPLSAQRWPARRIAVALMQSKCLTVIPRLRMSSLLRRIGKPADVVVDAAQARDLAKREGLRMVVAGRIEPRGLRRRLGEAVALSSEQSLPLAQATTSSLPALKRYARSLRVR